MHLDESPPTGRSRHPGRGHPLLVLPLLSCAVLVAALAYGTSLAGARSQRSRPVASAAGLQPLSENEYFSVDEVTENHIVGRGRSQGAVSGTGSTTMNLISASKAKGEFTSRSGSDSVTVKFAATYSISGEWAYFTGTVIGVSGTGRYANAVGRKIGFSGKMNRVKETMTMTATGQWSP